MFKNINELLNNLSNSKYFLGIMMIIVNIGARFIIEELTHEQKEYMNTPLFRRIIIFSAFFIATKDILTSIILTIIFVLFISEFFANNNELKNDIKNDIKKDNNPDNNPDTNLDNIN